jgi:transcriptional regulator with XRE-family HTH domain
MNIFGKRLEKKRKEAGWTKTYTAKMLKLPLTTYANYEYGNREPDMATITKIATLFNTTTDYLLGKNDDPEMPRNKLTTPEKIARHTIAENLQIPSKEDHHAVDIENDELLSYRGRPIPDDYLDIIKNLMDSDIKHGRKR